MHRNIYVQYVHICAHLLSYLVLRGPMEFHAGSAGNPCLGDGETIGYHGAVMAALNEALNLEVQCAKTGAKIQYKDEILRSVNEMYTGAPPSPSFKRKARAIGEGSQSPMSPRSMLPLPTWCVAIFARVSPTLKVFPCPALCSVGLP